MVRNSRATRWSLTLVAASLSAACGLLLVAPSVAAQTPDVTINYDVLHGLATMPAGEPEPAPASESAAPAVFAVPESRLLIRPKKSTAAVRRPADPGKQPPPPQSKPTHDTSLAARKPSEEPSPETDPPTASAEPTTASSEEPGPQSAPAAPKPVARAPSGLAVPPPPPDAPNLADLTSDPVPAPAAKLAVVPDAPAPIPAPGESSNESAADSGPVSNTENQVANESEAASEESTKPAQEAALNQDDAPEILRILFDGTSVKLSEEAKVALTELARSLREDKEKKVKLLAHASDEDRNARRTSLTRARAVRSFLVDKGVASTRIDVRPLGATSKGGPPDRVDIVDARR